MKIILLLIVLASCSTVKKTTRIEKTHKDSAAVEVDKSKVNISLDSSAKKTNEETYTKETTVTVDTIYLNKVTNQIVYVPRIVIKEVGTKKVTETIDLTKSDKTETDKTNSVKVTEDKKTVDKTKAKSSFSWWWLLWLIPILFVASLIYKPTREWWWDKLGWAVSKVI